jgi:hypothetical protein
MPARFGERGVILGQRLVHFSCLLVGHYATSYSARFTVPSFPSPRRKGDHQ